MPVKYYFGTPNAEIPNFTLLHRSGSSWWGVGFTDDVKEQRRLAKTSSLDTITEEEFKEYLKKKQQPPSSWTQVRGRLGTVHVPVVPGDNPAAAPAAKDTSEPAKPPTEEPLEKTSSRRKPRLPKSEMEFLEPMSLPDPQ